jgi:uncharacterized membrane protein
MGESGSASIDIKGSSAKILRVIGDIEALPSWMDAVKSAEVLERDERGRPALARFDVDARIKRVRYTLRYSYPDDGVAWEMTEGDLEKIAGSYQLRTVDDVTTVTYNYDIDPGFPMPGFLRRKAVEVIVSTALEELKKRVESLSDA